MILLLNDLAVLIPNLKSYLLWYFSPFEFSLYSLSVKITLNKEGSLNSFSQMQKIPGSTSNVLRRS